ncbi:unnamed protein product [Linum trigynum]|uniref:Uncharacterized protein n=1 Tax=Linum trigynum TaxID=586398 RepID=A0AAV2CGY3_9ROSI
MLLVNRSRPRAARKLSRSSLAVMVRRCPTSNKVNPTTTLISQVVVVAAARLLCRRRRDETMSPLEKKVSLQILPFLCRLHRHLRPRYLPPQSSSTPLAPASSIAIDDL